MYEREFHQQAADNYSPHKQIKNFKHDVYAPCGAPLWLIEELRDIGDANDHNSGSSYGGKL